MNLELKEIKREIRDIWSDPFGRVTLNPAAHSLHSSVGENSWDSENQLLFTGTYAKLLDLLGALDTATYCRLLTGVYACQVPGNPGLFNRHPGWSNRTISHDEMNGLMFLDSTGAGNIAETFIEYGEKHSWAFVNENPGANGLQLFAGQNTPLQDGQKSRALFPYIHRIRQPRDRCFYKLVAGKKPNALEVLSFCTAAMLSANDPVSETSGRLMWVFKFLSIDTNSNFMIKYAEKLFYKKLVKDYGAKPLKELFRIYYRPDHPMIKLVDLLGL